MSESRDGSKSQNTLTAVGWRALLASGQQDCPRYGPLRVRYAVLRVRYGPLPLQEKF